MRAADSASDLHARKSCNGSTWNLCLQRMANRRPPMPFLITMLGGTIAAVCSRCQSERNYEFATHRLIRRRRLRSRSTGATLQRKLFALFPEIGHIRIRPAENGRIESRGAIDWAGRAAQGTVQNRSHCSIYSGLIVRIFFPPAALMFQEYGGPTR
jgi:hypothetical protein